MTLLQQGERRNLTPKSQNSDLFSSSRNPSRILQQQFAPTSRERAAGLRWSSTTTRRRRRKLPSMPQRCKSRSAPARGKHERESGKEEEEKGEGEREDPTRRGRRWPTAFPYLPCMQRRRRLSLDWSGRMASGGSVAAGGQHTQKGAMSV
jgi:hypothetical protein